MPPSPCDAATPSLRDLLPRWRLGLLESLVLVSLLGVGFAVVVPKTMHCCGFPPPRMAQLSVEILAYQRYPEWALAHPSKRCPATLLEIAAPTGKTARDLIDPWGTPYVFGCRAIGIAVRSAGEDRLFGTDDDIRSDR